MTGCCLFWYCINAMGVVVWNLHLLCILCVVGKQAEDKEVLSGISGLVKENIEVLGGRTSEEGYIVDGLVLLWTVW